MSASEAIDNEAWYATTLRQTTELLEAAYRESDRYLTDAVAWVQDAPDLPASLVMHIAECYDASAAYRTVIDDALDGEVRW